MTGLAQVMGRDDITDEEKVKYDKYYLENQNFFLDMRIIYKTIQNTITSKGVKH
ncbi:undecaprenyl-phosphate galactose phosphotransferase [Listeria grayi]|nr:undecaprenyl-phosphate galactose phosphotransferase [Listeria grayi]